MGIFNSDAGADRRSSRMDRNNRKQAGDKEAVCGKLPGTAKYQSRTTREDGVNKRKPVYVTG